MSELSAEDLTADERAALDAQAPRYSKHELAQIAARRAAQAFMDNSPSFYACSENIQIVVDWMISHDLQPTVRNFETAAAAMEAAGLLLSPGESEDVIPEPEMTLKEIDAMPSGEYRQRLNDAKFVELVNRLEAAKSKIVWRGRVRS